MILRYINVLEIVFFLFGITCSLNSVANYSTKYFTVNNGLSNNTITTVYQSKAGYIWVGTDDGLNLFDGYNFKIFRHEPDNKNSISHNRILFIKEDSKGNLWVGTSISISKYNPNNNTFSNFFINY